MRRLNALLALAAVSLLAACGGPENELDDGLVAGDELASLDSDLKIDFQYSCNGAHLLPATLTLKASKATFTDSPLPCVGTYDSSWHDATQSRYKNFTNWGTTRTTPTMYIPKSMRSGGGTLPSGAKGGVMTMSIAKAAGGIQYNRYTCVRSTGPVTLPAATLPPTVLQYVGTYNGTGHLTRLVLARGATFTAKLDGASVSGTFVASGPHAITLATSTGARWTATWPDFQGSLDVVRGTSSERLAGTNTTDDEGECDDTHGGWNDDDAGPDGTFCLCPAPQVLIWSAGGCTR